MNNDGFRMYNPNQIEKIRKQDMFGKQDGKEYDGKFMTLSFLQYLFEPNT